MILVINLLAIINKHSIPEDKQYTIELITQAHKAGCRLKPAYELWGINIRTLQR
jgi:hypothetical protein